MAPGNLYSTLVAWLKILLPLAALGILSSVVFFARDADEQRTIPFVSDQGAIDAEEERLTQPEYVGLTSDGSSILILADRVVPDGGNLQVLDARNFRGVIEAEDGRILKADAPDARLDLASDIANLFGDVTVRTSDGFEIRTNGLLSHLDVTLVESEGPLSGVSPFGSLDAGNMRYSAAPNGSTLLVFDGGVKLLYQPGTRETKE
ncbi:MAG: hypothetical protein AAF566_01840 [Pseudomonadota bacterium]